MKIGKKLTVGFVGIALLVGVVGHLGFNSNKRISESAHTIDLAHYAYEEIAKLEAIVLDQVHEGMHLLSFEEEACIEAFKELGKDFRKQLEETRIAAAVAAAPELQRKFQAIEASHEKFEKMFDEVVKAHYAGQLANREQRHDMHGKWCPVSDEVIELTRGLQPLYTEMVEEARKRSEQVIVSTTRNIILASIVAVFLALGLGLLIARTITNSITKLKNAATEISKGKLNTRVEIKSKDEIGFLAASFNKMAEDLSGAMEKEKELAAAAAAAAADAEKKKAEELATMNEELESTNEEIKQTNEELESATEELRKANEEAKKAKEEAEDKAGKLEKMNKFMVGREIRMVELKEEVNTLLKEMGRERKYREGEENDKSESV